MAESAYIDKLSPMHEAMVNYLIEFPSSSRKQMALHFNVTVPWLSTIIHSDVFQEKLRRRQDAIFNVAIARPIQERLLGAAHVAIDKMYEALESGVQLDDITRAVDMLVKATGNFKSAPAAGPGQVNNTQINVNGNQLGISRDQLMHAKMLVGRAKQALTNGAETVEQADNPALPAPGEGVLGEASFESALLGPVPEAARSVGEGNQL